MKIDLSTQEVAILRTALHSHECLCRKNKEDPFESEQWMADLKAVEAVDRRLQEAQSREEIAVMSGAMSELSEHIVEETTTQDPDDESMFELEEK